MLVTAAGIIAFRNDAVGFLVGMIWYIGLYRKEVLEHRRQHGWFRRRRTVAAEEQSLL